MKEIGGFLELEINHGQEYHTNCIALNSGRNCLRYLLRARDIKKIWLPKLLCSAISDTCIEEKVHILYYSVDGQLKPVLPDNIGDEWLYLINYYGQYSDVEIASYSKKYKNMIVDNAQAFYSKPLDGIDTIYTCRKFFGVPDGGYLYTNSKYDGILQQDESYSRIEFLAGRLEHSAQQFYSSYRDNESIIDKLPLKLMSKITHNLLRGIDYKKEATIREENYMYLHKKFADKNLLILKETYGPYMYPLLIENGSVLRDRLQKEKIYIPILWPNVKENLAASDTEYWLANNLLPLPCDQRYTIKDMDYMIKKIEELEKL